MIGLSNLSISYIPCVGHQKVKITYGMLSSIDGQGYVKISNNLVLNLYYMFLIIHATLNL